MLKLKIQYISLKDEKSKQKAYLQKINTNKNKIYIVTFFFYCGKKKKKIRKKKKKKYTHISPKHPL